MLNIEIKTIPHNEQRYETVGDYFYTLENKLLNLRVSDLSSWKKEMLVAIHELIEVTLCESKRIDLKLIDKFDIAFEQERELGLHTPEEEPGDSPKAPYHREHIIATMIERMLASEMGVDWKDYETTIINAGDSNVGC